jgi:hypothetical protein
MAAPGSMSKKCILSRFQAGRVRLKLVWYGVMLTAILLAPLAVLLAPSSSILAVALRYTGVLLGAAGAAATVVGSLRACSAMKASPATRAATSTQARFCCRRPGLGRLPLLGSRNSRIEVM